MQLECLEIRELLSVTGPFTVGQYDDPYGFEQSAAVTSLDSGASTPAAADASAATLPAAQSANVAALASLSTAAALSSSYPTIVVDPTDGQRLMNSKIYGEWNTAGNTDGWAVANAASSSVASGILTVTSQSGTSNAVQVSLTNIANGSYLDYGYFDYLQIRLQLPANYNKDVTFSFGTTINPGFSINPGTATDRSFVIPAAQIAKDGNFHTYRIDLGLVIWWRDTLRDLQIRPLGTTGANETANIDYLEVGDMPGDVLTAYATGLNMAPGVTASTRQSVESKHFVFWWDPAVNPGGNTNWSAMQRNALRMMEESYQVYTKVLGFKEPFSYAGDGLRHKVNLTTWYGGYWMGGPYLNVDTTGLQDEGWGSPVPHEFGHVTDGQQSGYLAGGLWESHANYLREARTNWFYPFFSSSTQSTMDISPLAWSNYRQDSPRLLYSDYRIWLALQNIASDPVYGINGTNPLDPNIASELWTTGSQNWTVYDKLATLLPTGTSIKDVVASVLRLWPMLNFQTRNFLTAHLWTTQNTKADYDYRTGSYLIPESDQAGWYRVPLERAPEKYAFMFHDLVPNAGSTSITVQLRGMDVIGTTEDWRWCLSEIDANNNVVAYSDIWGPGTHTFTLQSSTDKVQLIVVATPSDTSEDLTSYYNTKPVDKNIDRLNYPYEVQITGATPAIATEQLNYAKAVSGHYHSNGGGWVDNTATVAATAYVGPNARVLGSAQVSNYARIEDYAVVAGSAKVQNYAIVSGYSVVKDSAIVRGNARIRDHATIAETAVVQDNALVEEFAYVISNTIIKDSAIVCGDAYPFGGTISGTAIAGYDYSYNWSFSDGTHFGHFPWGDWFDAYFNSTQSKPRGLVASYRVEETAGELLWDEFGAQHAFLRGSPTRVTDTTMNSPVLQLNGASQYVVLDRSLADMTDATYGLWLNPTSSDANETLLYFGGSTGNFMKLVSRDANGFAHLTMSVNGTVQELVSTVAVPLNQWTYLALTFGGGAATFYINGQAAGSLATTFQPTKVLGPNDYKNPEAFYIGRDATGNYFTGRLEDMRFYNVTLSQAELANEMSRSGAKIGQFLATAPMTFDGSTTMMESGVHNGLTRTLEAWIKPKTSDNVSYYEPIFDSNDEVNAGYYGTGFGLSNGIIKVRLDGLGFWSTGVSVVLNKWQNVAVTFNGTTAKLYINGVLKASKTYSANANNLAGKNYRIGWGQSGSDTTTRTFFDGQIYDAEIYDSVITPTPSYGQLSAVNDSATLLGDSGANTINVLTNDYDTSPVVESLTVYSVTQGAHGAVTKKSDGSAAIYTPVAGFAGADSFTYTITDGFGHYSTASVQITVDVAPTDITLSSASVSENQHSGTTVGVFSTTDNGPIAGPFTYTLVSGTGSTDNASFTISGNALLTAASFNYEVKNSYSIRARTTDQGGLTFEKVFTIAIADQPEVLFVNPSDWTAAGLTLKLDGDGKLHIYQTDTIINAVPPHNPANVTGVSITGRDTNDILTDDYIGGYASLLINYATFKINQDDAISAGTNVTIDGGILDLNGKTDTIGNLLLKSGSVIHGALHANAYTIESGTVTANISGPGDLQKTTTAQATTGAINTSNVSVNAGQLTVDSIITGTLTVGPGATLTIAPIAGGPLAANSALTPLSTRALRPTLRKPIAQPTATNTIASSSSTATITIAAGPIADSTVFATPAPASSEVTLALASSDSLSTTFLNAVATPTAIVADIALPVHLVESTQARLIDTSINSLLPQSPIYFRLDSTALHKIIESGLEQSLTTRNGNITSTRILDSLRDELPSHMGKIEKHPITPAINSRQAHIAALQTNYRWSYLDAEVDFDIAQHVRAGKHFRQLEKAIDEVLAEGFRSRAAHIALVPLQERGN